MGRQLYRVPLDFDWPRDMPWRGFVSPYRPQDCRACRYGEQHATGYSPEGNRLANDPSIYLSQEEVDWLVEHNDLRDLTHSHTPEGYKRTHTPTVAEVNKWLHEDHWDKRRRQYLAAKARCWRDGIDQLCRICRGNGYIWATAEFEKLAEEWEGFGPPEGEGYQLWETVSEGSPISPVFATAEELAAWLVDNCWETDRGTTYEQWLKFINGSGHAVSLVVTNGEVKTGVQFEADRE